MEKESSLVSRMADYQYGSYGADNLKFNAIDDLIEVEGFYSGVGKVGVCNEQNENFARENSDLGLVRVLGKEPKYFSSKEASHYFLVKPSEELPDNFYSSSSKEQAEFLKNANSKVVDASMKVVDSLENSGYTIGSAMEDFPIYENAIFDEGRLKPLGINSDGNLLYLGRKGADFKIFSQEEGMNVDSAGIPLEKLSQLASVTKGSPELGALVSKLNEAYVNFKF